MAAKKIAEYNETVLTTGYRLDLELAVSSFYALKAVEASPQWQEGAAFLKSREAFEKEFKQYTHTFERKLARVLFDYLTVACFGEARHAAKVAVRGTVLQWANEEEGELQKRDAVYLKSVEYDPQAVLPQLKKLFLNTRAFNRHGSVGGGAWADIARAALLYFKADPAVFIDHVVDLSHNSNLAFDKPMLVTLHSYERYQAMLDRKTDSPIYNEGVLDNATAELITRAQSLGYIKFKRRSPTVDGQDLRFPKPIKWGSKTSLLLEGGAHVQAQKAA